jgi:hypothetical protein
MEKRFIDENIFSRICSAILDLEGYKPKILRGIDKGINKC